MSKTKTYTVALKATAETDPIKSMSKALMDVHHIMSMVHLPFRLYHTVLLLVHTAEGMLGISTAATSQAQIAQTGVVGTQTTALALLNAQLAQAVVLQAALAGAVGGLPGMAVGATGGLAIVAASKAAGVVSAIPGLQEGGTVMKTGLAVVHEGERFSGVGGGGGGLSIVNYLTVANEGMDLTDFTDKMNDQFRTALRSHTRDVPV